MTRMHPLTMAALLCCGQLAVAEAQSLDFGSGDLRLESSSGGAMWVEDGTATCSKNLKFNIREGEGPTVFLSGCLAFLELGGPTLNGDGGVAGGLSLRDSDGTTSTVSMYGSSGRLTLGAVNEDGDIVLKDSSGADSITLDGETGNVTNQVDGNGLVKAWARVDADGTLLSAWNCSSVQHVADSGLYNVNCSAVGATLHSRPRIAVLDSHGLAIHTGRITVANGSAGVITVFTEENNGQAGLAAEDRGFNLVIY